MKILAVALALPVLVAAKGHLKGILGCGSECFRESLMKSCFRQQNILLICLNLSLGGKYGWNKLPDAC